MAGSYTHTEVKEGQIGDFVYEWVAYDEIMAKHLAAEIKRQQATITPASKC